MIDNFNLLEKCEQYKTDNIAIRFKEKFISYGDLVGIAKIINHSLKEILLLSSNKRIALYAKKTITYYASLLACENEKACFVPLHPSFPKNRLESICNISCCETLICSDEDLADLEYLLYNSSIKQIISLNERTQKIKIFRNLSIEKKFFDSKNLNTKSKIIDEAYVLFTSGSTGIPKGISISRINLYNYLNNIKNVVKVSSTDNLTHLFELSFDLSIHDIYITLLNGATLCIPTKSDLLLPVNYILRNQITIWFSVPSFIANMAKLGILKKEKFSDIHTSLFCGEPLTILNAQLWQSACPDSKVINLYGPTEATIATTFFEYTNIDKNNSKALRGYVPIGNPFGGNRCYLKNLNDEEILQNNDNNEGELILFGDQVCKGYLNNKKKSNENFIKRKLKFDSYEKEFYLTGDIVRYTNKFGFIFLSRKDNQIKLNGHRIELGEVEYRIREITESSMVACIIKKVNGVERLICYWQNQGKEIDKLNIFEYLKKYLPAYMIPFEILNINTMPLNTNSKIDRKTLEGF